MTDYNWEDNWEENPVPVYLLFTEAELLKAQIDGWYAEVQDSPIRGHGFVRK